MNSILIRRPQYEYEKYNNILPNDEIYLEIQELYKIQLLIEENRLSCSDILYSKIPKLEKTARRKALDIKRKIYNSNQEYNISFIKEIGIGIDNDEKNLFERDIIIRKLYKEKEEQILKIIEKNIIIVDNALKEALKDIYLEYAIMVSNSNLYKCIYHKKKMDKTQKLSMLKYMYKITSACTPSFLWAGFDYAEFSHIDTCILKKKSIGEIYGEKNYSKINIEKRKYLLNKIEMGNKEALLTLRYYINPTCIILSNGSVRFFRPENNMMSKFQINTKRLNYFLEKNYDNDFSFQDFASYWGNDSEIFFYQLLKLDVFRSTDNLLYYNALPEIIDLQSVKEKSRDYDYFCMRNSLETQYLNFRFKELLKKSHITYIRLHTLLFKESEGNIENQIKEFLGNRQVSLLEFLHSDFKFRFYKAYDKEYEFNYRSWNGFIEKNTKNMENLVNYIKQRIGKEKCLHFSFYEVVDAIGYKDTYVQSDIVNCIESVTQIDISNDIVIPEMYSMQIGKLIGRFLKYLMVEEREKVSIQIQRGLSNEKKYVQTNVQTYSNKDSLAYNIKNISEILELYDCDVTKDNYKIKDLFLMERDEKIILVDKTGDEVAIYNSSTLTPNNDKLYFLLNFLEIQDELFNINGRAFSRIELDLDYQPRIIIDNLLFSRERYRLDVELVKSNISNSILDTHFNFLKMKYEANIPDEVYIYSDGNFKPRYCTFKTYLDIQLIINLLDEADKYIYFEEVYPNKDSNRGYTNYNIEIWSDIWLK